MSRQPPKSSPEVNEAAHRPHRRERDTMGELSVPHAALWGAGTQRAVVNFPLGGPRFPRRFIHALERTRDLMDSKTRDCLVTGYEPLIPALTLPDSDDRHVLAAAIVGRCDVIVTQNLKRLSRHGTGPLRDRCSAPRRISVQSSALAQELFCVAVRSVRLRLKNPPYAMNEYLDTLTRQGLVSTVAEMKQFSVIL